MMNRIGKYCGAMPDIGRATTTLAFCDAIWQLHADPNALQDWEVDSLCQLDHEAAAVLRDFRAPLPWH